MEEFIKTTITKAGEEVMSHWRHKHTIKTKTSVWDIVTEADIASEKIIIDHIQQKYPDHGIVSEESESINPQSEYQWYIDPLDGTKNYESGVQLFGINMALTYKGELTHAAIFLPALNELCYAEKGKGVTLNDIEVHGSAKQKWTESPYGLGSIKFSERTTHLITELMDYSEASAWLNTISCTSVGAVWLATGRRDFYIGPGFNPWDNAAPVLLARESGYVVTNFKGEDWDMGDKGMVVANQYLHPKLMELVKKHYLK